MISRDESFEWIFNEIIRINNLYKPEWRKWDIQTFGIGLSKEVGEICDDISVIVGGGTKKKPKPTMINVKEEVIDVLVYAIMYLDWLNVDYETFMSIFRNKLEIITKRLIENSREKKT